MREIFERHEKLFCVLLIIAYLVTNSYCMRHFGYLGYQTAIIHTVFSLLLIGLIIYLGRVEYYGLTRVNDIKKYLYFVPLVIIGTVNLWHGFNIDMSINNILKCIFTMINIAFIEEIIFRGFLFKMIERNNAKTAIIVSSLIFGFIHILNFLYGTDIMYVLLQICYCISLGYLFALIFYKSKSLVPCIITHVLINSFAIFNVDGILASIVLIIIPFIYAMYISKKVN